MRSIIQKIVSAIWIGFAFWLAVRYLLPVTAPFLLGTGLALAAEPGVGFLTKKLRLPRAAAAGIGISSVFLILCVLVVGLFTLIFRELGLLAGILPDMEITAQNGLNALQTWLLSMAQRTPESIRALLCRNVSELFSGGSALLDQGTRYILGLAGSLLSGLPRSALSVGTAVLSAFLISAELPRIRSWLHTRIPGSGWQAAVTTFRQIRSTAAGWITAQVKLMGITFVLLLLFFLFLKVRYAPIWALAVAVLDAFPILGTGTVLVPWSLVCLLQQDTGRAAGLIGCYITVSLTRTMLEPRFVGHQLGLDPLVTLIAIYTGFRLWGFAGMLFMPLLAITTTRMLPENPEKSA